MQSNAPIAAIGIGSNLGNRLAHLRTAVRELADLATNPAALRASSVFATRPVNCPPGSGEFYNAAAIFPTRLPPLQLLQRLREIERLAGRPESYPPNTPRPLDLDLLFLGDSAYASTKLTLPHPRLHERRFVLEPLADIDPSLPIPPALHTASSLLNALGAPDNAECRRIDAKLNPDIAKILRGWKHDGHRIAALTAYDYPGARLLDEAGIDLLLVGDSLGMVVLGLEDTTEVTMDDMVHHTAAAARGTKHAILAADLPANSYRTPDETLANSLRLLRAGAQCVKFEGAHPKLAHTLAQHRIPLLAHLGMLPQHVREEGGYKRKGKTHKDAERLLDEAISMQHAGACAVILEIVQPETAANISRNLDIPTIGIGSGNDCDGQILVTHDLIGQFPWFTPKFARKEANTAQTITNAVTRYIQRLRGQSSFPCFSRKHEKLD